MGLTGVQISLSVIVLSPSVPLPEEGSLKLIITLFSLSFEATLHSNYLRKALVILPKFYGRYIPIRHPVKFPSSL